MLRFVKTLLLILVFSVFAVVPAFADQTSALLPSSDGNYTQWTPKTGSTHYTMVDESSCNGNSDYNSTNTLNDRDSYGISLSSIPNNATITQVDITPCASKNGNGGTNSTMKVFYRLDGTDSSDSTGYSLSGTNPSVLATTSYSGLSTVKSGSTTFEIGAVLTAGTKGARLSNISVQITYSPAAPTVTTTGAVAITQTSASLSATINPNGATTNRNYRYDTSNVACASLANSTSSINIGSGTSNIAPNYETIATLSANTTYYYCAVATNSTGTTYGSVLSFTTLPNPPTVTTNAATSYIGTTSATLNSTVNPNGGSTNVFYRYGTSNVACSSLPSSTSSVNIGSGTSDVSPNAKTINNLTWGTTYYFCTVASNSGGTTFGSVLSFVPLPNSPSVTTGSATSITQTSANVSATINPNGASTDRYYRYDTSNVSCSSLANTTSTVNIGSGTSDVSPNAESISSLSANTTYYYCTVATNLGGTTYGSVLSFTTLPNSPTVTTNDATEITATYSATLNSTVNPNGGSTSVRYRYDTNNNSCASLASATSLANIGAGTTDVSPNSKSIFNLSPNTVYYFCAVATNSGGTSYGNVLSFTTLP